MSTATQSDIPSYAFVLRLVLSSFYGVSWITQHVELDQTHGRTSANLKKRSFLQASVQGPEPPITRLLASSRHSVGARGKAKRFISKTRYFTV